MTAPSVIHGYLIAFKGPPLGLRLIFSTREIKSSLPLSRHHLPVFALLQPLQPLVLHLSRSIHNREMLQVVGQLVTLYHLRPVLSSLQAFTASPLVTLK